MNLTEEQLIRARDFFLGVALCTKGIATHETTVDDLVQNVIALALDDAAQAFEGEIEELAAAIEAQRPNLRKPAMYYVAHCARSQTMYHLTT